MRCAPRSSAICRAGCRFATPAGGMFFWVELPAVLDATALLPRAVDAGVAYVPGARFFAGAAREHAAAELRHRAAGAIDSAVATLAA